MSDTLGQMRALMRDLQPPPRRELRCGKTAWDVLRSGMATDNLGGAEPLSGWPVHIDHELRDAAWQLIEDGEVVQSGDMAPDHPRAIYIGGVGLIGVSEEVAEAVAANVERARRGGA